MKLAVIGKDVSKSTSPKIHTFIARNLGLDMTYVAASVPEDEFESRIDALLSEYDGMNVTIPYKLSVIPHLKKIEGDALAFGAVNTIVTASGTGYNTDGLGFMQMLSANNIAVSGKKVLLLGAGGAGRSVAKKLKDGGAEVEIYDRFYENAKHVSEEFGGIKALSEVVPHPIDIIINATGVGMHKTEGISPVSSETIAKARVAVDLIYVPEKSEFLRLAEGLGKQIVNGAAMLFYQAYYSDCYYFNLSPDPALAKSLFEKYLKS